MRLSLAALLVTLASATTHAGDIACRVVGVTDGDTLTCLSGGREQIKVRLGSIDAPEKSQDFGQRSKAALSDLVYGRDVHLQVIDTDRYGRTVAKVIVGGTDVNLEQVKSGMAWVYRKYAKDQRYLAAERAARSARAGLWADSNPVEPSVWRKNMK